MQNHESAAIFFAFGSTLNESCSIWPSFLVVHGSTLNCGFHRTMTTIALLQLQCYSTLIVRWPKDHGPINFPSRGISLLPVWKISMGASVSLKYGSSGQIVRITIFEPQEGHYLDLTKRKFARADVHSGCPYATGKKIEREEKKHLNKER